jgi:diaminohydroxyphosphoribosylaminopyrimidine deaminase/5-amino-6-(5-phosphoribosylamino)uracil reductase
VATASQDAGRIAALCACGAEVLSIPGADDRVDLRALMAALAQRGVNEVHVEGGAGLNGALLAAGLVDELLCYVAPSFLGGDARPLAALPPLGSLDEQIRFVWRDIRQVGDDLRLLARVTTESAV